MKWVIRSGKGILKKPNNQYLTFDTADDALTYIKSKCANSPYLTPLKLINKYK